MKKINAILTVGAMLFAMPSFAQQDKAANASESFGKGTNLIGVGIGIGGEYTAWNSGYTQSPNFVATYENGTFGNVGPGTISLGGLLSYKSIGYKYTDPYLNYYYNEKWTYWIIGLRSAYHWNFTHSAKCDPYAGAMLAYYYLGYNFTSNDPYYKNPGDPYYYVYSGSYNSYLALSLFVGFRYYLSNNIALWAELGYGYSNLALGVSFKL